MLIFAGVEALVLWIASHVQVLRLEGVTVANSRSPTYILERTPPVPRLLILVGLICTIGVRFRSGLSVHNCSPHLKTSLLAAVPLSEVDLALPQRL